MTGMLAGFRTYLKLNLALWQVLGIWRMTLLVDEEEEGEEYGDLGSAVKSPPLPISGLEPFQHRYASRIGQVITNYSRLARRHRNRYHWTAGAAISAAAAVPVALASSAPVWVPAALGGIAAAAQGMQQLWQDQRLSIEYHQLSVGLSGIRRNFELKFYRDPENREILFDELVKDAEEYQGQVGASVVDALASPRENLPAKS